MENNLWNTLQEVEKVNVSFKQTLRNINDIQNRYKMVSALRSKASKRKASFEAEIQAAITAPNPPKKSAVKKSKISMGKKRRVRKSKANVKLNQRSLLPIPAPNLTLEDFLQVEEPFVCLETNCVYEIHKTTTRLVARKPYGALIRRLYRLARMKRNQDQEQDQEEDQEEELEEDLEEDLEEEVSPDWESYHCSCSACCIECR
ncbi:uncharacterized protein LOC6526404 [Drosophila yakuba]|uniref:Uncharacterized protein n=1 Tax=Drosophila yakuba TaxID=7245 RepID=B4P3G8_DROYA|nr:uncharacterized protein LOC6526404 [Drosophila yakuba]EDW87235.1 uncharacterized protein Dyak_GE15688 [Drosophila yakuba]